MNILWLINIVLPCVARSLYLTPSNTGGWLSGQLAQLDKDELTLTVVTFSHEVDSQLDSFQDKVHYVVFPSRTVAEDQVRLRNLLEDKDPDLVHIHGTELSHSLTMMQVAKCPTVISLQGLVHVCAEHYFADLPMRYHHANIAKRALRQLSKISGEFICDGQAWFEELGKNEKIILRHGTHFIGRTGWDEHHLKAINANVKYYHCGEILRPEFYDAPQWQYANCKAHSIFISQGNYPLKGFHILLEAVARVKKQYPDVQVFLTGTAPLSTCKTWKEWCIASLIQEYPAYLAHLLRKLHLKKAVHYLGNLNAEEMRAQYLSANAYVLASSVENSPNSLAEAMMLGVPCIASDVGGVRDMMENQTEGFLYPFGDVDMLAHQIEQVFAAKETAAEYGKRAMAHAVQTHDPIAITQSLMDIYEDVIWDDIKD